MTEFSYSMDDLIRLFNRKDLSWEEFRYLGDYVEVYERIDQSIVDLIVNKEMSISMLKEILSAPIERISVNDEKG